jgi:hypothetical protein
MATRRGFLAGLAALALPRPSWADVGQPAYLAAARQGEGFFLHGLDRQGASLFSLPLPARGHAAAAHPHLPLAVAFARRPGTFALVLDCRDGRETARLTPPEGRQFNGHGVFSADGTVLYTSEVLADGSKGRIGLWDAANFRRIGEWASGGIGPHDIKLRGDDLVIANGGIATDPKDRRKLNIDSMRPNLTLLGRDGRPRHQVTLPPDLRQNSIRHLALGPAGQVAFAMQWEGDEADPVPLLGLWTPGAAPVPCPAPEAEAMRMKGYAGSIAWSGDRVALTSPRGGVAMLFDADGRFRATLSRADICGIAASDGGAFIASDGFGGLARLSGAGIVPMTKGAMQWDNHMVNLPPVA